MSDVVERVRNYVSGATSEPRSPDADRDLGMSCESEMADRGAGGASQMWGRGASGNEIAMNAKARPDLVFDVRPRTAGDCPICEYGTVSSGTTLGDVLDELLTTGTLGEVVQFVKTNVSPELGTERAVMQHMMHCAKDPATLERHMTHSLKCASYAVAMDMSASVALNVSTAFGEMCMPNRNNIAGFAQAVGCYCKLVQINNATK